MVKAALIHLLDINPVEIQNNISKNNFNINEVGITHNMMHNLEENNIKIFLTLALFDEKEEIIVKSDYNFIYNKWFLDVKADAYGNIYDTHIMFNTVEEALKVKNGYKFLG